MQNETNAQDFFAELALAYPGTLVKLPGREKSGVRVFPVKFIDVERFLTGTSDAFKKIAPLLKFDLRTRQISEDSVLEAIPELTQHVVSQLKPLIDDCLMG